MIESPCIGVCTVIDNKCIGCLRTSEEIKKLRNLIDTEEIKKLRLKYSYHMDARELDELMNVFLIPKIL